MATTGETAQLEVTAGEGILHLAGPLGLAQRDQFKQLLLQHREINALELSGLTRLDTVGAMALVRAMRRGLALEGLKPEHRTLLDLLADTKPPAAKPAPRRWFFHGLVVRLGKATLYALQMLGELVIFLGRASTSLFRTVTQPSRLRFGEIIHHIEQIGINAIPIIGLIAFLISVVLAYQSTEQLRPLGAQQFTINLITISVLREMGVLLTAIMVAGRSGSAFTAEIGVMKLREEVDALKAIGIDPFELLVVPRLIAIVIALPILTFIANLMGLLGGAVLTHTLIGTSFEQYFNQVHDLADDGRAFFVGMIKAPVFAFFIGLVACMQGMKVTGSAESVGTQTTTSVVQSIFLVLVLDALFSIFFQQVGL